MTNSRSIPFQPTVLGAAWRYRYLVLLLAVLLGAAGWYYGTNSQTWTATASMTLQDPQASAIFSAATEPDPKRYVASQRAIMESRAVAELTAENLATGEPPISLSADSIEQGLVIGSTGATDVITVSYSYVDGDIAIATVNAAIDAYAEVSRTAAQGTVAAAIAELDQAIAEFEAALADIANELSEDTQVSVTVVGLERAYSTTVTALLNLEVPNIAEGEEALAAFSQQFAELEARIKTLQNASEAAELPVVNALLLRQRADIRLRLAALQPRRDELAVDAQVAGNGIAFVAEARTAYPSSVMIYLLGGTMLGALLGGALAFYLAGQRSHFGTRTQPQVVLGTNLLADIPHFAAERIETELPVLEKPHSASAESFRFVANGLAGRHPTASSVSVAVVAASHQEGTTVVTANTALAAARSGARVAIVDGDFASQSLTHLLQKDGNPHFGLTDIGSQKSDIRAAAQSIPVGGEGSLSLFSRGTANIQASDFFASAQAAKVMKRLRDQHDLVLVDTPPLLRVAYSGSAARIVDAILVVVGHESNVVAAAELRDYLLTLGTPMVGYVYNRAPLRREMIRGDSQLLDQDLALSSTESAK